MTTHAIATEELLAHQKSHLDANGKLIRVYGPRREILNEYPGGETHWDEDGDPHLVEPTWWYVERCEMMGHEENDRLNFEAQQAAIKLKDDVRKAVKQQAANIGGQYETKLKLKLESGADPLAAFERVLTGMYRDEEHVVALLTAYGRIGHEDEFDNLVESEDTGLLWIEHQRYVCSTDAARSLFMEFMQSKGPKDSKGNRREPIGFTTAEKLWSEVSGRAYDATWGESAPTADEWLAIRIGDRGGVRAVDLSDPDKVRSIGFDALVQTETAKPLLTGLIMSDSVTYLVGQFGTYKTFTLVAWALSVASGKAWCGHTVPEAAPVLYVAAEGRTGLRKRFQAAAAHLAVKDASKLHLYTEALQLADIDTIEDLIAEAKRVGAKLLILDTLHKVSAGLDTMGDGGAGVVAAALDRIKRETGATIVVAHHTGYAGEHARGSSALEDDADMVWLIKKKGTERILTQRKNRDDVEAKPSKLAFVASGESGYVQLAEIDDRLNVDDLVDLLDDEDLADDASERLCREALAESKFSRADLRSAMQIRKDRVE